MSKIAFLFPGQGAQTVGMGRQAAESLPAARRLYDRAAEVLGYDLAKLCFEGPAEELDSTVISQPALFVTSLAAIEQLRDKAPDVVLSCEATAGLSLGEYTALVFAGAMEFEDGPAAGRRAGRSHAGSRRRHAQRHGQRAGPRAGPGRKALCEEARGDETLQIANLLCPGNIVISGTNAACERAAEMAPAAGAMKAVPLAVAGAFHTPIMASAVERLREALAETRIAAPTIPVISNVDARPHFEPDEIRELLRAAARLAGALGRIDADAARRGI